MLYAAADLAGFDATGSAAMPGPDLAGRPELPAGPRDIGPALPQSPGPEPRRPDPRPIQPGRRLLESEVAALYDFPAVAQGAPVLRCNMVMTADGGATGHAHGSREISGDADRRLFSLMRALSDAVIVAAGTWRNEGYAPMRLKPTLVNLRRRRGMADHPTPVLVTGSGRLDPTDRFFTEAPVRPIVVAAAEVNPALARVADVVVLPAADPEDPGVDLGRMISHLGSRGLTRLLTEGGPGLLGALLRDGLLTDYCMTVSAVLVGGSLTDGSVPPRPTTGPPMPEPDSLRLLSVALEDEFLFLRYQVL